MHYGGSKNHDINFGTLLKQPLLEYINKEKENKIIAEIKIKEEDINKDIRIINSYVQSKREKKDIEGNKENKNEEEIKENCKIEINNEIIPFCYFYKFNKIGKYKIKLYYCTNKY